MQETLKRELKEVLTTKERNSISRVMTTFWGSHQRFFNQMCMGAKVSGASLHSSICELVLPLSLFWYYEQTNRIA